MIRIREIRAAIERGSSTSTGSTSPRSTPREATSRSTLARGSAPSVARRARTTADTSRRMRFAAYRDEWCDGGFADRDQIDFPTGRMLRRRPDSLSAPMTAPITSASRRHPDPRLSHLQPGVAPRESAETRRDHRTEAAAVGCRRPDRFFTAFAESAADRQQPAARRTGAPQSQSRSGKCREHRKEALESSHPARRVRQMPLPFSLNATSSTRCRMTNSPRPNSRSRLSGWVGSGVPLGSKPLPSSTTWMRT